MKNDELEEKEDQKGCWWMPGRKRRIKETSRRMMLGMMLEGTFRIEIMETDFKKIKKIIK